MTAIPKIMIKCIFVGNLSVGKTSIILRYTKNEYSGGYIPTIGADFTTTSLTTENLDKNKKTPINKEILKGLNLTSQDLKDLTSNFTEDNKIYLWDLAGQPLFRKIRTYYMSNALFAVVVLDLSKPSTFAIDTWVNDIKTYSPNSDLILVGNKNDIVDIEKDDDLKLKIHEIENRFGHKLHITSAKTGEGILDLFNKIKIMLMQKIGNTSLLKN
jgi:Ras-related protein Rab-5C